ncbi:MAG: CubicO group peptidase (beta-lactamase class C family) [Maribacter sp.]|jgi:CubicO group peptidase (beta-lactamase class C family)
MKKHITILIILSCFSFSHAQNWDSFIQNEMNVKHIPGISVGVIKGQEVVWSGAYGYANIEDNIPVTTETLFTIASISKLFVATSILQLYENGLIDLDADINSYLDYDIVNPNFPNMPITARMLLEHKSSLKDPESQIYNYQSIGDYGADISPFIQNIITPTGNNYQGWYFSSEDAPGTYQLYSNIGFTLLAVVLEHITDIPYHQYVKENIFEPLCMDNSSFFYEDVGIDNVAMPYDYVNGNYVPLGYYAIALYPSALIKTNVIELSRFLIAYTGRGAIDGYTLLENSSVDLLTPFDFNLDNLGWWNGTYWTFTFHAPNDEVWFHGGYMPGIRTRINYYPSDSTGIIILTNGEGQYGFIEEEFAAEMASFATSEPDVLPCFSSAVSEINTHDFSIYPNPSNGDIYVKNIDIDGLQIFDVAGRKISFQKVDDRHIRIEEKGIFVLSFLLNEEVAHHKILVK